LNPTVSPERHDQPETMADVRAEPGNTTISPEASQTGLRLDEHHATETNGRMAVCRRCGTRTDGPEGRHAPYEQQLAQAGRWLDAQALGKSIAALKLGRDT
jgi:hypothetical protein